MARTTEIEAGGEKYKIASLTLDQTEELFPPRKEGEETKPLTREQSENRIYKVVEYGLNNVFGTEPEEIAKAQDAKQLFDKARIRRTFDLITFPILHREILIFTGLANREEMEKPKPTGEAEAAPTRVM